MKVCVSMYMYKGMMSCACAIARVHVFTCVCTHGMRGQPWVVHLVFETGSLIGLKLAKQARCGWPRSPRRLPSSVPPATSPAPFPRLNSPALSPTATPPLIALPFTTISQLPPSQLLLALVCAQILPPDCHMTTSPKATSMPTAKRVNLKAAPTLHRDLMTLTDINGRAQSRPGQLRKCAIGINPAFSKADIPQAMV